MFLKTATAIITPFQTDGSVDYESLKKFVDFQIEGGVDTLVVLGTTGEAATIDTDEREKIIDTVVSQANGRVKIIIGTGTNDTKHVIKNNQIAEKYKADGLLIVNPYYNKGTQRSIIEHYRYISERTPLDILLYNVPSRTGMNLLPETALSIAGSCRNVKGIKEASGDISQIARLIADKPEGFDVIAGNDDQVIPIMALGGIGVISTFSNVMPNVMVAIVNAMLEGNYQRARSLNNQYLKFMNDLFLESNPVPVKYALSYRGLCQNIVRLPLIPAAESTMSVIDNHLETFCPEDINA